MNTETTPLKDLDLQAFQAKISPVLKQFIRDHQETLKGKQIDEDKALRDMYALVHGNLALHWSDTASASTVLPAAGADKSPCVIAIATTVIDCVAIVLQAAGVPGSITRAIAKDVVDGIAPAALNGLLREVKALEQAEGLKETALAIFHLFGGVYKITGIRQILGAIEHHLAFYEWVIMGAVITAQITAWVASDGIAAVAEIVILGAFIGQAVADAASAVKTCKD